MGVGDVDDAGLFVAGFGHGGEVVAVFVIERDFAELDIGEFGG